MHQSSHKGRGSHVLYSIPSFIREKASVNSDNKINNNRNMGIFIYLFRLSRYPVKETICRKRDKIRVRNKAASSIDCAAVEER